MRTFVTGAMGQLGRRLIRSLQGEGHETLGYDLLPQRSQLPGEWVTGDLADKELLHGSMDGAEAVVHLGAISDPVEWSRYPEVIEANVTGTFNVFEAARLRGIRRVVFASSLCAIGPISWSKPIPPDYLPLDEQHETRPDDNYGTTKLMGEHLANDFHVRFGLEIVCLRFTGILFPDMPSSIERYRGWLADLDGELVNRLWSYLREEDALEAVIRALRTPGLGFEKIMLAAPDSVTGDQNIEQLVARHYPGLHPDIHELRKATGGNPSVISTDNCRRLLGWRPSLSYLDLPDFAPPFHAGR